MFLGLGDHELSVDPDNSELVSRVPESVVAECAEIVLTGDHVSKLLKSA